MDGAGVEDGPAKRVKLEHEPAPGALPAWAATRPSQEGVSSSQQAKQAEAAGKVQDSAWWMANSPSA